MTFSQKHIAETKVLRMIWLFDVTNAIFNYKMELAW